MPILLPACAVTAKDGQLYQRYAYGIINASIYYTYIPLLLPVCAVTAKDGQLYQRCAYGIITCGGGYLPPAGD